MLNAEMKRKLLTILRDDIGRGDVTSALLPPRLCEAVVIAKKSCVVAGLEEAKFLFKHEGVKVTALLKDGDLARKNATVLRLHGSNRKMFSAERTVLNVLGRMSGVATACLAAKKIAKGWVTIALTRKTAPGFNLIDKKAGSLVGVWPHRINLNSFVLLKDNHLPFFASSSEAILAAKKRHGPGMKVEVEVESLQQALDAVKARPSIIMLDNFSPQRVKRVVKELRKVFSGKIELSGGISLHNLHSYVKARPDIISMGSLTHVPDWPDFSLRVEK